MSSYPLPIAFVNSKESQARKLEYYNNLPYPATSYSEYKRWKKWLYGNIGHGLKRHDQINEWARRIYQELKKNTDLNFIMDFKNFRYFLSWYLFNSSYHSQPNYIINSRIR